MKRSEVFDPEQSLQKHREPSRLTPDRKADFRAWYSHLSRESGRSQSVLKHVAPELGPCSSQRAGNESRQVPALVQRAHETRGVGSPHLLYNNIKTVSIKK